MKTITAEPLSESGRGLFGFFKEIYLTIFILFYRVGSSDWPEATNRSKGAVGVSMVAISLIVGTLDFVCTLAGKRIIAMPKWAMYLFCFVIWLLNFYALVIRRHGLKFETEFNKFSKLKRNVLRVAGIVVFLGSIGFLIYSVPNKRKDFGEQHKANPGLNPVGLVGK